MTVRGGGANRRLITSSYKTAQIIKVKPNTNYVIDGDFTVFSSNVIRIGFYENYPVLNEWVPDVIFNSSQFTFTTGANINYILLYNIETSNPQNIICSNLDLEEGTVLSSYTPHAEKTYNFPLSSGQKLMEDGTIENKVVNEWGEIELDGSDDEGWERLYTDYFVTKTFSNVLVDTVNTKCTIATITSLSDLKSTDINKFAVDQKTADSGRFWFRCSSFNNSLTDWKAYLAENPIKIHYKLATPDETAFTPAQQAVIDEIKKDGTYKEGTHYTAEASINPDMEIGYYKNLETELDNIKNAVIALGGDLNV